MWFMNKEIKFEEDNQPLMVTIQCITYNHEPFIRECLEGFVMQKTNFRFEAVVHDDASTDGTANIIREYAQKYPDIIKPIFEVENQYSKHDGSLGKIMNEHTHGKYIAICEGDDYWTDPYKLQKQVDFMEDHLEYGLCYTNVLLFYDVSKQYGKFWGGPSEKFEFLLFSNTIPAMSVLVRTSLVCEYFLEIKPESKKWKMGDYPMWLYVASKKKIKYLPFTSGGYRILENSASHSTNPIIQLDFVKSSIEVSLFFAQREKLLKHMNILYISYLHVAFQMAILENKKKECNSICKQMLNKRWIGIPLKLQIKTILLLLFPRTTTAYLLKRKK